MRLTIIISTCTRVTSYVYEILNNDIPSYYYMLYSIYQAITYYSNFIFVLDLKDMGLFW